MEYEIDDDPQGFRDRPEGDRDGGLREDRLFFRIDNADVPRNFPDDPTEEGSQIRQFGELV